MSQLKRYNGSSWEVVGGNIAPKTTQTNSDTDTYSCNYINTINDYSTSEINTGKKWIDGKPIYRKIVYVPSLPNAANVDYNHNISNVDTIWIDTSMSFIKWSNGATSPFNYMGTSGGNPNLTAAIEVRLANNTKFSIETYTVDRTGLSAYVSLNYTKTTD